MNKFIESKLLDYQITHCNNLISAFNNTNITIDASDTGTGKTYCSLALCKHYDLKPIIVCPKSVINNWKTVTKFFDIIPETIINYEQLIRSKNNYSFFSDNKWILQNNHILILDEVHKCKNNGTKHAELLLELKDIQNKVIILSATIADKVGLFNKFGYILNLYRDLSDFESWLNNLSYKYNIYDKSLLINKEIFPKYGSRMKIKDIEKLPENHIDASCYKMNNADKIAEQYNIILESYNKLKEKCEASENILSKINNARQTIELLKVPTFIELIKDNIKNGKSSVVFVNFNDTMIQIAKELNIDCLVYGSLKEKTILNNFVKINKYQSIIDRDKNIKDFQDNIKNIIILNIRSGSAGISLHDLSGDHQRVSIISPTWSAQDFIQVLGRIYRSGAKSDAIQKIIYCEGTIETAICKNIETKLNNLSKINNGDVDLFEYEEKNKKLFSSELSKKLSGDDDNFDENNTTKNLLNPINKLGESNDDNIIGHKRHFEESTDDNITGHKRHFESIDDNLIENKRKVESIQTNYLNNGHSQFTNNYYGMQLVA